MGWFTKIDAEVLEWETVHWKWLLTNLKSRVDLTKIKLITPTPEDFPVGSGTAEEKATAIFQCVQKHLGMEKWPCRLEPFEEVDDLIREAAPLLARPTNTSGAAGLFEVTDSNEVVIRYKLSQVNDPISLIATMAHELSHYLVATIKEAPPTGWNDHEPLTDLTAVFFGFGIFLANSAVRFDQWQDSQHQGWSARSHGYLSESSLSLALAMFCTSKNLPPDPVRRFLSSGPKHYFKVYYKDLLKDHGETLSQLREGAEMERHTGYSCPGCHTPPPVCSFWVCDECGNRFDTFETEAVCPSCKKTFPITQFLACKSPFPISSWKLTPPIAK